MGEVYYNLGFLASKDVIECSASDLVGQYVGQTGPKTKKMFERASGRVLFVDEAYRLAEGHFAQEAMDEMVALLTNEQYRGKLIVILAGYDDDMNRLMSVNSGLSSRFPEELVFKNLTSSQCVEILRRQVSKESIGIWGMDDDDSGVRSQMEVIFDQLSRLSSWGNARDVGTLAKRIISKALTTAPAPGLSASDVITIPSAVAIGIMMAMLHQQEQRLSSATQRSHGGVPMMAMEPLSRNQPAPLTIKTETAVDRIVETHAVDPEVVAGRDPGVTDAIWQQLQRFKQLEEEEQRRAVEELSRLAAERAAAEKNEEEEEKRLEAMVRRDTDTSELMKARETARIAKIAALRARQKDEEARQREEAKRKEEARVQAKIRAMGVCPVGFRWIKTAGGYRCAGGSHFLGNDQLDIE
jgi:hypothetical protein